MPSVIGRPLSCTYLREVHLGVAEGDALDVGQGEAILTEPLCKRKVEHRARWAGCLVGTLGKLYVVMFRSP